MKIAHSMIRVKNIDKSVEFYRDVIGLKLQKTMELKDATLYFMTDEAECCSIELTYNHNLPEGGYSHGNYFGHFAFITNDMDAFTQKLESFGLEYSRPPFLVKEGGPKIAFLLDPDGFQVEIIERK